jgi:hypothetical protein
VTIFLQFTGWFLVGIGLFALTEGYHALRQRAAASGRNRWWLAVLLAVAALALIRFGFALAR